MSGVRREMRRRAAAPGIFYRCRNLLVRDVFLTRSAYHCVRLLECRYVRLDGVRIHNGVAVLIGVRNHATVTSHWLTGLRGADSQSAPRRWLRSYSCVGPKGAEHEVLGKAFDRLH